MDPRFVDEYSWGLWREHHHAKPHEPARSSAWCVNLKKPALPPSAEPSVFIERIPRLEEHHVLIERGHWWYLVFAFMPIPMLIINGILNFENARGFTGIFSRGISWAIALTVTPLCLFHFFREHRRQGSDTGSPDDWNTMKHQVADLIQTAWRAQERQPIKAMRQRAEVDPDYFLDREAEIDRLRGHDNNPIKTRDRRVLIADFAITFLRDQFEALAPFTYTGDDPKEAADQRRYQRQQLRNAIPNLLQHYNDDEAIVISEIRQGQYASGEDHPGATPDAHSARKARITRLVRERLKEVQDKKQAREIALEVLNTVGRDLPEDEKASIVAAILHHKI